MEMQLINTKASSKMSLLHFVALTVETKFPELKTFLQELESVPRGARGTEM